MKSGGLCRTLRAFCFGLVGIALSVNMATHPRERGVGSPRRGISILRTGCRFRVVPMRKQCRRKVYALVNPIKLAIEGASITADEHLDKLRLRELSAIEAFKTGKATPHDFRDIADMLNLAETMGKMGIGPEALISCRWVEVALMFARDEYERKGKMSLVGTELKAVQDLYEFHDLQRTSVDRSTYERVIKATRDRIKGAHPDVKILT